MTEAIEGTPRRAAKSRDPALEALRGLASLQVLLLHVFSAFWPALVFGAAAPSLGAAIHSSPLFLIYDGYQAPYLFFVLSGYVLTPAFSGQIEAPGAAIVSRWVRLAVPALAACAVSAAAHALFQADRAWAAADLGGAWLAGGWDPPGGVANFFIDSLWRGTLIGYTSPTTFSAAYVAPLWTLSIEFRASIVTFCLVWASLKKPSLWRSGIVVLALVCVGQTLFCFVVGHWLAKSDAKSALRRWPRAAKAALALAGAALMWADERQMLASFAEKLRYYYFVAEHIAALYGALCVFVAFLSSATAERWLSLRPLVALGRLSFPLYLIHWPIVFGLGSWTYRFARTSLSLGSSSAAAITIVTTLLLSLVGAELFAHVDVWAVESARRLRMRYSPSPESLAPTEAVS